MLKSFSINKKLSGFTLLCLLLFFLHASLFSQEFIPLSAEPVLTEDSLQIKISFPDGLFKENSKKAFLAGLPVLLEMTIELKNTSDFTVTQVNFSINLQYFVWEEVFLISGLNNLKIEFDSLQHLQRWLLPPINLQEIQFLPRNAELRLTTGGVLKISRTEKISKLSQFLNESEQTEESVSAEERSTGFKLNLNRLVRLFVSREEEFEIYNLEQTQASFKLSDLR